MMRVFATISIALLLSACIPHSVCEVNETRCTGVRVEICDSEGQWAEVMDCTEVESFDGNAWACCPVQSPDIPGGQGHACLPVDECGDGGTR
ncbi:MAG: hypothetical protein GY854_25145 [Deltaproteobacteria bacterium]|nr:hypothetical protein [Deltaproteobacteria bacterium]